MFVLIAFPSSPQKLLQVPCLGLSVVGIWSGKICDCRWWERETSPGPVWACLVILLFWNQKKKMELWVVIAPRSWGRLRAVVAGYYTAGNRFISGILAVLMEHPGLGASARVTTSATKTIPMLPKHLSHKTESLRHIWMLVLLSKNMDILFPYDWKRVHFYLTSKSHSDLLAILYHRNLMKGKMESIQIIV